MNDLKKKQQVESRQKSVSAFFDECQQSDADEDKTYVINYFANQLTRLKLLADGLQESVRVVIDLDPCGEPKIGVTKLKFDELTANFPESESQVSQRVLIITSPDGRNSVFTSAVDGLIWFVNEVGVEPIAKLNLIFRQNKPLLSRQEPDDGYFYPLTDGWYLHTDGAKLATAKLINRISKLLNLDFSAKREKVVIE
jgi:hypothetical protein